MMDDLKFDAHRRDQLQKLEHLLREASSINRGNRCLERIADVIETAEELTAVDMDTPRDSFMQFLIRLCHANRAEEATDEGHLSHDD